MSSSSSKPGRQFRPPGQLDDDQRSKPIQQWSPQGFTANPTGIRSAQQHTTKPSWKPDVFVPNAPQTSTTAHNPSQSNMNQHTTQVPTKLPKQQAVVPILRPPATTWQTDLFVPGGNVESSTRARPTLSKKTEKVERLTAHVPIEKSEWKEHKAGWKDKKDKNESAQSISPIPAPNEPKKTLVPPPFLPTSVEQTPTPDRIPESKVIDSILTPGSKLPNRLAKKAPARGGAQLGIGFGDQETAAMDALLSRESRSVPQLGSTSARKLSSDDARPAIQEKALSDSTMLDAHGFPAHIPLQMLNRKSSKSQPSLYETRKNSIGLPTQQSIPVVPFEARTHSIGLVTKQSSRPLISSASKSILRDSLSTKPVLTDKNKKKQRAIGWSADVFVVNDKEPSNDTNGSERSLGNEKRRSPLPSTKSMRIDDKDKRDMRWNWNQLLISKTITPYRKMLAKDDDLLPDNDDFNIFEDSEDATREKYDTVRDAMLNNGELTEREVGCFFEGFSLFTVKVRSLESQLESMKVVSRAANSDFTMRSMRSQSIVPNLGMGGSITGRNDSMKRAMSGRREMLLMAQKSGSSSADETPPRSVNFSAPIPFAQKYSSQKSLRAMSIRKIQTDHKGDDKVQKLLAELEEAEKKQKKLEKQLQQAGIKIAEDIPFEQAKAEVARIAKRMGEIGSADVKHEDKMEQAKLREEYFKLEQDMEKFNNALTLTDEWIEEQEELEQKWENDNAQDNEAALRKVRRHMPVDVKSLSEAQLSSDLTPNGKVLPQVFAKKFKRTNVLQLIRTNPDDLVRVHPSTLENLRVAGLTLTERRALYAHLLSIGPRWKAMQSDQMTERKWNWYETMKLNFKENLDSYLRHVVRYGPPENHPYATRDNPNEGCPLLGKQCPIKADKLPDYDDDYGYTEEAVYEISNVSKADAEDPGAKAIREAADFAREKKAGLRSDLLKKHYKGKVLQVSLANGSCEAMDDVMDKIDMWQTKWIEQRVATSYEITDSTRRTEMTAFTDALNELKLTVLQFAERSGMQLTGKKDANADQPDIRSPVELGLSEDVYECADAFFSGIIERIEMLNAKDGRMKLTIEQLRDLLVELHERNIATMKELGVDRPDPSRKLRTRKEIESEAKSKLKGESTASVVETPGYGRPPGGPGRGGLMDAIAGRGRGGGPGRGGLMDAIAGRGRGGGPGRGGLLDAIAGRGRGGGPGRGGLLDAIAGRGANGPGRGGLMDAIAARGRGGENPGRGGLMAAIAGRGRGRGDAEIGGLKTTISSSDTGGDSPTDAGSGRDNLMSAIAARGSGNGNAQNEGNADQGTVLPVNQESDAESGDERYRDMQRAAKSSQKRLVVTGIQPHAGERATGSGELNERATPVGMGGLLAELQARQARKAAQADAENF